MIDREKTLHDANVEYVKNFIRNQKGEKNYEGQKTAEGVTRFNFKLSDFDKFIGQEFMVSGLNKTAKLKAVREITKGFFVAELDNGLVLNFCLLKDKNGKYFEEIVNK
jgi:hypothetical protein